MKVFFTVAFTCLFSLIYGFGSFDHEVASQFIQDTSEKGSLSLDVKPIEVLLLVALPGSGKSEVRRYLASLSKEERLMQFGIGEMVQFDDFPYVHMMRRISEEMQSRGYEGFFFPKPELSFVHSLEWGTLMHLINEDYKDLTSQNKPQPSSAAEWLFDRLDAARQKAGDLPLLANLPLSLRQKLAKALEKDAQKLLNNKNEEIQNVEGKTIVIEFSRGGHHEASMPLPSPYGYQYSLSQLMPEILEKASILYIWVTPEESRRKNEVRANPNDPGSILHHNVPLAVMYGEYGCDDISYLLSISDKSQTVTIHTHEKDYYLPIGRFDNRIDKTSFIRDDEALWKKEDVAKLKKGLREAFTQLMEGQEE